MWHEFSVCLLLAVNVSDARHVDDAHSVLTSWDMLRGPAAIPIPAGDLDPANTLQRYRRSLYPSDQPFYQWWYFWAQDRVNNVHWGYAYQLSVCGEAPCNATTTGAFVTVCRVSESGGNYVKTTQLSLDAVTINNDFDVSMSEGRFGITVLGDGEVRIHGRFDTDLDPLWYSSGASHSPLTVAWNITFTRRHGWYPERFFEIPDRKLSGIIMWNPYAHSSDIAGHITEDTHTTAFTHSAASHGYADMNWGVDLPRAAPGTPVSELEKYSWGWYAVAEGNVSIIGGVGMTYANSVLGSMAGRFIDVRIGDEHFEALYVTVRNGSLTQVTLSHATDGTALTGFHVEQTNWVTFRDDCGTARLPLTQNLIVQSANTRVELNFTSASAQYNRLLFTQEHQILSDFEALGTNVSVRIERVASDPVEFQSIHGGVEFGYEVPSTTLRSVA